MDREIERRRASEPAVSRARAVPRLPALAAALALVAALPSPAAAQQGGAPGGGGPTGVQLGGLLIGGFRAEPEESARKTGFDLLHARLNASGTAGLGVEYRIQTGFDSDSRDVNLLDAELTLPVQPELEVSVGQFKAPFSREALDSPAEIQFATRSQAAAALAPLRQVGAQLSGVTLDRRLRYRAGVFNGEGRTADNPDGEMLYAARVEFSRLGGSIQFYDELNVTVGANLAASGDSARDVTDAGPFRAPVSAGSFRGDRILWGGDVELAYRAFFLNGEYLRGEFDPDPTSPGADDETQTAEGVLLEGGYKLWGGLVDLIGRWDAFDPPAADRRDFLVFGANLYPGLDTRLGVQFAERLDDGAATLGPRPLPGGLADGQFVVRLQLGF